MTRIDIYDTTLRDGTQGLGFVLSLEEKLQILIKLDEIGVDYVEGGFPLSNPKEIEFFKAAKSLSLKNTKLAAFGMTRKKGFLPEDDAGMRALIEAETPVVTVVGKTWVFHVREVLGVSKHENISMISDSIKYLSKQGRNVIYDAEHFFDGYREDPVYAIKTLEVAMDAGADIVVLCDTNGGTLYYDLRVILEEIVGALPSINFGIHTHNDCGFAVSNTLEGVRCGAIQVQGTINGVGERCGNVDLIAVIANLGLKMGYEVMKGNHSIKRLTELSRFVDRIASRDSNHSQSFVGRGAFSHKGGMHAHAVLKNVSTYEHMPPESVGNERNIIIGELSGISGINDRISKQIGINKIDKNFARLVLEEVSRLEYQGYVFEHAEASLELLIRRIIGNNKLHFTLKCYQCDTTYDAICPNTKLDVTIDIDGDTYNGTSEDMDVLASFENAVRNALTNKFPCVSETRHYNINIKWIKQRKNSRKIVRVVTDFTDDDGGLWTTMSIGQDVLHAFSRSIVEGFQYKIFKWENNNA